MASIGTAESIMKYWLIGAFQSLIALNVSILPRLCAAATTGPELVKLAMKFASNGAVLNAFTTLVW
jgi:hypothetical protein